jgi:nicotinamide mononucleotide adenylyltransferase
LGLCSIYRGSAALNGDNEGSAHGRFQPFHNEHLEYVLAARRECRFLWIGMTKYDLDLETSPLGRDREKPENNPLTYYERIAIIREALTDCGVAPETFNFIPFPIEHPHKLKQFLSTAVPCFTTICEDWNREKIKVLEGEGYVVKVLWEREKKVTGRDVRERIIRGDHAWREMVPSATARAVERLNIQDRLRRLRGLQDKSPPESS